jgi:signal transduction histidine kinase/integral membrane sensor domain MASE1
MSAIRRAEPQRWAQTPWRQVADEGVRRAVETAVLVGIAYYVGARIGFLLQLPFAPTSVLWPPNAILTAALLLTPVRRWWMPVLAVVPAHLLVQVGVVQPPSLIAAFFVTNWSEALLAAIGVRLFSDAPTRLDTLRRMAIFIVATGLVAPFVSSFVDAAAVTTLSGQEYWAVWRSRFFANVLTELTLASAIIGLVDSRRRWIAAVPGRRAEAILLAVALLVIGLIVLGSDVAGAALGLPGGPLVLLLLPVLLWGAVRFGPAGGSLSLVVVATLAVWGAHQGRGPFTTLPPDERVIVLQISLIMVAIPLLCLAAVVAERRHAEAALNDSLRFEALLSQLSSSFVRLPAEEIDAAIRTALGRLGEFLGLHRLTLVRLSVDGAAMEWHSWKAPATRVVDAPGAPSQLSFAIPLLARGRLFGKLTFDFPGNPRLRPPDWIPRLTVVAEVLGSTLADMDAETALRASESMKSAILASLTTRVAVLDREARIVAVNEAWRRFEWEPGLGAQPAIGVGANYLERWRQVDGEGNPYAPAVVAGVRDVLDGTRRTFSVEYPCRPPSEGSRQWWAMSVVPLTHPEGGAVVSLADLTARRTAEMEAQRMRQELAHFSRLSTMGELTASLAHELNQPLTAILANAQAARRFLDAASPDVDELRAILTDIVHDDRRAGEIIHRLRDMLAKRDIEFRLLDLNVLIEDVIKLLSSDLLIHNVTVAANLTPELPQVSGDGVQLQQVVLNLVLNAMDAIGDDRNDRTIVVCTESLEGVHVSVRDSGPGLGPGTHDLVFQPFYTTKSGGMGMGLAVARSIVEAHGGVIWVTDNPTRGVTFHFALPAAPRRRDG